MNLSKRTVFIILAIIISLEAIVLLSLTNDLGVLGGDAREYHNLAVNLFSKGVFSSQSDYPFEPTVFRSIGYPLFLGSIYSVTENSIVAVRFVQFVLFLFSCYLLFLIAERFVGKDSAFYSAVFCAIYLPLVFLCLYGLTEILSTFLVILSVFLTVKIEEGKTNLAILLGLVLGCLTQVRPNFLLFSGLLLLAVFISKKIVSGKKLIVAVSIIIGLILCIFPWTIRNKMISGEFLPIATGKGISLYVSAQQYQGEISYTIPVAEWDKINSENNRRYTDSAEKINALDAGRENAPENLSLYPRIQLLQDKTYTADALDKFLSVPLKNYLFSYPKRIAYLFSTTDSSPSNMSLHRLFQLQFAIFALLILVGVSVQRKLIVRQYLLWFVPVYIVLIHSIFHVESRYSIAARPFLLIYAGIGFSFLIEKYKLMKASRHGKAAENTSG